MSIANHRHAQQLGPTRNSTISSATSTNRRMHPKKHRSSRSRLWRSQKRLGRCCSGTPSSSSHCGVCVYSGVIFSRAVL
eukprot:851879-Rhodomonas_salina.1